MNADKRKAAPDAATSQGGKSNNPNHSISKSDEIVKALQALGQAQRCGTAPDHLCPRCGYRLLDWHMLHNPVSDFAGGAQVHICHHCAQDERERYRAGEPPMPLEQWDYVRRVL